jgi:hypothetical protein
LQTCGSVPSLSSCWIIEVCPNTALNYKNPLQQYLDKSLQSKKNSSTFPDFRLIETKAANNNFSLGGYPAYEIVWTYKHPTYGMRILPELGPVVNESKGYFMDYAASIEKYSKYLPIAQDMKDSFKISINNTGFNTSIIR